VDGSIRIVQQFEQVFQPYHMMLKVLKEIKRHLLSQCFCKERKNTKRVLEHCLFGEGVQSIMHGVWLFMGASWNLTLAKSKEWMYCSTNPHIYKDRKISCKHTVLS
jgi:hypothetical protein